MNCPDDTRLNLFPEGEGGLAGSAERSRLEAHLDRCSRCRQILEDLRSLADRAARLPREIAPRRDLWPGVLDAITVVPEPVAPAARIRLFWPAAAGVAFLLVSTVLVTLLLDRRDPVVVGPQVAVLGEIRLAEAEFDEAAQDLMIVLESRADLSRETRQVLDQNVALLDSAIAQTRRALLDRPASLELARMLTGMHHKKIDLLRTALHLPPSA